jgi:hypothetical protein
MKRALILLLISPITVFSQTPYYDAIAVSKHLKNGKLDTNFAAVQEYGPILNRYLESPNEQTNYRTLFNAFTEEASPDFNPFLDDYFVVPAGGGAGSKSFNAGLGGLFQSVGGTDVTTFADGLAKFLVKRTKEELYVTFFEKLADTQKLPEFKILFPRTKELVDNFKSWEYANIVNTLKESFEKDLKELLKNLPKFATIDTNNYTGAVRARLKRIRDFFGKREGIILLSAVKIGDGVISGDKLPDIIHTVGGQQYLGSITQDINLKNSFRLLDILSLSLRNSSAGKNYITRSEFDKLFDSAATRNIFLGLLYAQIKNESIIINGLDIADAIKRGITDFKPYFENLIDAADVVSDSFKELKTAKAGGEDGADYWANLFDSFKDFISEVQNVGLINANIQLPPIIDSVFNIGKQALEIAHDISARNYNAAIISTLNFIARHSDLDKSEFASFLVKYGSFAANVVQADNSDEVEKAIESVVLPVGSASIKKHSQFNIALQAYVGLYGGRQRQSSDTVFVTAGGVYAPVGINFSWGMGNDTVLKHNKKTRGRWATSIFVSVIDISPLVTYRFSNYNEELANDIKIRLNQIFSPGLQLAVGFPKIPVSLGGGFNWTPLLTKVEKDKITALNIDTRPFRWQIFMAVDIPLLNFHTTSRKNTY